MTKQEKQRLKDYYYAKLNKPLAANHSFQGRRLVKGRARGVGQVLARSKVTPQRLSLEK